MRQSLTPTECDVAQRLARGQSFKWIAAQLNVSENSARGAAKRAYRKAGVSTADELVAAHGRHHPTPSQRCYRIGTIRTPASRT